MTLVRLGMLFRGSDSGNCGDTGGDYRLICEIQNEGLVILVVKIGHRREVYR